MKAGQDGLTFDEITTIITYDVMEQYEQVRKIGCSNMRNVVCVCDAADRLEFDALADVYGEHYSLIWRNFGALMRHYGIEQ